MAIGPQARTGLTHLGTALGGAAAAATFLATKRVDLYAIWEQFNAVIAAITTLIAAITPIATAAYGVYKASTKQKLVDVVADPKAADIARDMPVTPEATAVANALKA